MLPGAARLTRRRDFTLAVRQGRRAGRGALVVHLLTPTDASGSAGTRAAVRRGTPVDSAGGVRSGQPIGTSSPLVPVGPAAPARVGFVVGRTVGGSVDRHRVIRRLRHLVRDRLDLLPPGALVVVRALPAARDASYVSLGDDLDAALRRLLVAPAPESASTSPAVVTR